MEFLENLGKEKRHGGYKRRFNQTLLKVLVNAFLILCAIGTFVMIYFIASADYMNSHGWM